jgi:hypothetical protein
MPLSETAQKYAQAIFAKKVQELSREYESSVVAAKKNIGHAASTNRNAITAQVVGLKAQMLAGEVKAKADAILQYALAYWINRMPRYSDWATWGLMPRHFRATRSVFTAPADFSDCLKPRSRSRAMKFASF